MDFRFTPEQEAFRREIREFLRKELPAEWYAGEFELGSDEDWELSRQFQKKLAERGWLVPHWPKEYGGSDMGLWEQMVLREELGYHRAPLGNAVFGINMLGPILMLYGTEEQKREHLPRIARAEVTWCQGWSEPGSGSDLASLQTRAVRDGDEYVINGQKIWTTGAHRADWIFFLARTDPNAPKHKGISFFLAPMNAPGIRVQPIINMAGIHSFNQVFFEDVRIPAKNLVGEENRGWYLGAALLDFERSGIGAVASLKRDLDDLVVYCRETKVLGQPLIAQGWVRYALADRAVEVEVGRYLSYRVTSMQARGQIPNAEASMTKLFSSELAQRLANTGVKIMGLYGQVRPESGRWARLHGRFAMAYMMTVASTIAGGTSEIQRNIIATRGLGLPRG
jgi:alkylation response protein AidB-like acyl-CoA dehydrogenase